MNILEMYVVKYITYYIIILQYTCRYNNKMYSIKINILIFNLN